MECRLASMQDLNDIENLIRAAIEQMEAQGIRQWDDLYPIREDFEEDIKNNSLYIAHEYGKLTAIYVINRDSDEAYQKAAWQYAKETSCILHRLCVSPSVQHQGIGKKVLLHVEEHAARLGYESIRLDVFCENPYAQRLYRANGYQERGQVHFRKGCFDLMEKKL